MSKDSIYNRTVTILDTARNKFEIDCEVTTRNGYPEFSASGQWGNSAGQCLDQIKPASEAQRRLVKIWQEWHLNGMSAGTPEQQEFINNPENYKALLKGDRIYQHVHGLQFIARRAALLPGIVKLKVSAGMDEKEATRETVEYLSSKKAQQEIESEISISVTGEKIKTREMVEKFIESGATYDYDMAVLVLKMNGKHTVTHPEKEELFTYGKSWYRKDLPETFIEELDELLDELEDELEEGPPVTDGDLHLFDDFDEPEVCHALALMLELSTDEIEDISEDGDDRYTVQGTGYLAGDDDTIERHYDDYLEQYIDECIIPEMPEPAKSYFDRDSWKNDARVDGRGHSLNSWDGSELNYGEYYAYRQ